MMTTYNDQQWQLFSGLLAELQRLGINIPIRHMDNSGAILNYPALKLEMARPGIMTYGIYPSEETRSKASLLPVMSFKTTIVLIKEFPAGYGIGYNSTYITRDKTRVATIPVGYGDGYPFILSNQGEALIRGRRAPVIGRVSMDMCTLDVTHIPDCAVGDEVVLLGRQQDEYISANEIAAKAQNHQLRSALRAGQTRAARFPAKRKNRRGGTETADESLCPAKKNPSRASTTSSAIACKPAPAMRNWATPSTMKCLKPCSARKTVSSNCAPVSATILPLRNCRKPPNTGKRADAYFQLRTHVEYKKTIRSNIFMIGCASDSEQLDALIEDEHCEYRWILGGDDLVIERDFTVEKMRIDGEDIPIIEAKKTDRGYEVWCGSDTLKSKINTEVKIEIEILTKKAKSNRTFPVYLLYPTRGLEINFHYENAGLKNVRAESFFAGRHPQAAIQASKGKSINIKISNEEWIFPTSGVIFIWDQAFFRHLLYCFLSKFLRV